MTYNRNRGRYGRYNMQTVAAPVQYTCTDRQHGFALQLVADITEKAAQSTPESFAAAQAVIGTLTDLPKVLSEAWAEVSKQAASVVINGLLMASKVLVPTGPVVSPYPGLPQHDRVMTTRFGGKCRQCSKPTVAGVDLAVQVHGVWSAWCMPCATSDPAQRQAEEAAQAAAAKAEEERLRLLTGVAVGLARQAFDALGMSHHQHPVLRFALPSVTGNNDLDFFTVSITSHRGVANGVRVCRVIGGHPDYGVGLEQAVEVLKRLTDSDIRTAAYRYGQELGYCCRCGRHLTDEDSRAAGIGPDCASKV
jgi:hypothetical protein